LSALRAENLLPPLSKNSSDATAAEAAILPDARFNSTVITRYDQCIRDTLEVVYNFER